MIIVNSLLKQISLIYCNRLSILSIIELSFSFHGRATYIIYLYDVQNTAFLSSFKSIIFSILLIILLYWYHNKDIWEINGAQPTKELFNNENNESWSFETDWRFMMNFSDCFFLKHAESEMSSVKVTLQNWFTSNVHTQNMSSLIVISSVRLVQPQYF